MGLRYWASSDRAARQGAAELRGTCISGRGCPGHRGEIMSRRKTLFFGFLPLVFAQAAIAQEAQTAPRHITLEEAVQLAVKHNHVIRLASLKVEEKEHAKDV